MSDRSSSVVRWIGLTAAVVLTVLASGVGNVTASNVVVGLSESGGDVSVPTWLYLATGGSVVGASALLTMLVTDRDVIGTFHERSILVPFNRLLSVGNLTLGVLGVLGLGLVLVVGIAGPQLGLLSAAVLVTFVGGRALLTMVAYSAGSPWHALNPWRRIADVLPSRDEPYPSTLGSWPAVAILLLFVWLEIVAPLSSSPRALVAVLLGYSAFTLAGAIAFNPAGWFRRADPLTLWFRLYGSVALLQRTTDGLEVRFPGARLSDDDVVTDLSVVAFVLALVWELTYSGFVVVGPGERTVRAFVEAGVPPALVYLALLVAGFVLFVGVYWLAAARTRHRSQTYLSRRYLALRYAPSLLAIAAGYHLAHYAGFAITLWPSLVETVASPLNPGPNPTQYALTPWFGYVEIAGILVGHVLAVWVAHTISFELFPGKLQAIRSQYPFIVIMILFTMVSLYLVSAPTSNPPYVPS